MRTEGIESGIRFLDWAILSACYGVGCEGSLHWDLETRRLLGRLLLCLQRKGGEAFLVLEID